MTTIDEFLEVYVDSEGDVCIAQKDMNEDCCLSLAPEQVAVLIEWLQHARAEALEFRAHIT